MDYSVENGNGALLFNAICRKLNKSNKLPDRIAIPIGVNLAINALEEDQECQAGNGVTNQIHIFQAACSYSRYWSFAFFFDHYLHSFVSDTTIV